MNPSPLPLHGIRVADFGQVIAAPVTAQILGWLGAEVVLVETKSRMTTRVWPPFADGEFGIDRSGGFNLVNNNKLSCTLDLRHPDALELAKEIISVSDVLVENYATGVMESLGLGYDEVKRLRQDIVYMSLAAFGRSGPFKDLTGFHSVINLFSGLAAVTGYENSHPRIMGGLIPDAFAGCYCVLAVLEALYHRSRTGEGQFIEVSMTEALTGMIPEAVMEYSLTGKEQPKMGNRDGRKAPHNVFRCLGEEKWVAVSVETDAQFRALSQASGNADWADEPRFATPPARLENQDALEALLQQWTANLGVEEVVAILQAAGVPAAPVLDTAEVLADPHLVERGFVAPVEHPAVGTRTIPTLPWAADGRRVDDLRPAPTFGEHNQWVLKELLQVPDEEYERLVSSGAVG
jgi:crotonobetainyl-CoA:carnitine CoA-transferase CaiB-like acyl-CoA transferase